MQLGNGTENHPLGTGNLNAIVNGNWSVINNWFNPAQGLTAAQSGTTLTASAAIFLAAHVGATVLFSDGSYAVISSISSPTVAVMSISQTVVSQSFDIYRTDQTAGTALARGLMKQVRFVSGDDGKIPFWSDATQQFTWDAGFTWDGAALNVTGSFVISAGMNAAYYRRTLGTISYSASVALNFTSTELSTVALTGNITFTTSNLASGRSKVVRIEADGSTRNLTFPGGWTFVGSSVPANIAANKTALLKLTSFGTADADVIAEYLVQP